MLSVKQMMTLDFETAHAVTASVAANARKEVVIRELFDEHAAAYYQRLNGLLDNPEALAYSPMLVRRLRRLRDARRAHRSAAARTI